MIFTDPATGHGHGYDDRWEGVIFSYVGEGQRGNQQLIRGNKAILNHYATEKALRVFKGARGEVQYLRRRGRRTMHEPRNFLCIEDLSSMTKPAAV